MASLLGEPAVLDDVLVMGYPPISGFNAIQTSETATVGAYQKSSTGQIVGADRPYMLPLDFFLINARVKGGNSGGPVINNGGHVIGVVVKLPFDSHGHLDITDKMTVLEESDKKGGFMHMFLVKNSKNKFINEIGLEDIR